MTLKDWNALPHSKKRRIVNAVFWNMSEEFRNDIAEEFHHNFDWAKEDGTYQEGRWYKLMLSLCHKQKDGSIKVTITV